MAGQYELYDVPFADQFNSGLRVSTERGGGRKPAYAAYQAQLVVTRLSSSAVEVWGQIRPGGSATVAIQRRRGGGGVRQRRDGPHERPRVLPAHHPAQEPSGSRWRITSTGPSGLLTSRTPRRARRCSYFRR